MPRANVVDDAACLPLERHLIAEQMPHHGRLTGAGRADDEPHAPLFVFDGHLKVPRLFFLLALRHIERGLYLARANRRADLGAQFDVDNHFARQVPFSHKTSEIVPRETPNCCANSLCVTSPRSYALRINSAFWLVNLAAAFISPLTSAERAKPRSVRPFNFMSAMLSACVPRKR